ncbi:unnamed protein product [Bursaphelenchus xylophilus]|nr:unnamed protein product [Bursaphelenchus xylophilus]CAG9084865.1 unnamed protein product [Bursaphelenchus xylophilus]
MSGSQTFRRCLHLGLRLDKGRTQYYNKHMKVEDPKLQDPEYFDKIANSLPLDKTYIDSLKTLWVKKIGAERELMMKASDSLIGRSEGDYALPYVDITQPKLEYRNVDILRDCPEEIKKIFSIEFGKRSDLTAVWKKAMVDDVKLDKYDSSSLQSKIALCTALIRHWTALVDELQLRDPKKPARLTTRIFLVLGYRRKLLRHLREQDFDAFEKILKDLKISYQVVKPPEHRKTRKEWSEFKLKQRVEAEKEDRLEELRVSFEEKRLKRLPELENKMRELQNKENRVQKRIQELVAVEGNNVETNGIYEQQLIQELSEVVMHNQLLYFDRPVSTN